MGFVRQHPLFGAPTAPPLLAPDFLDRCALGGNIALLHGFDLVEQEPLGQKAIEPLVARDLALNPKTRRNVDQ